MRHLRLLDLIDQGGSLVHAARSFHLSQPAITKMLHELESVFGGALVERGPRGGTLTAHGRTTLARLRVAMAHIDAALSDRDAPVPTLKVGLLPLVAVGMLPRAMRTFWNAGHRVHLVIHEATVQGLLDELLAGQVDCVIGRLDPEWLARSDSRRLRCTALADDGMAFAAACGHPLAAKRRVSLAQLVEQRWVLAHGGSATRRQFDDLFIQSGLLPPVPEVESQSFHTNMQVVAGSDLLTFGPASAVDTYQGMGLVRRLKTDVALSAGTLMFLELESRDPLQLLDTFRQAWLQNKG